MNSPTTVGEDPKKIADPYDSKSYRYYALGIFATTYMFNFIDRQILSILQEPIKKELLLSDTQLGLLTGFAFAAFYILMGFPIARWADRGNRRNIVAFSVGLWSLMTAVCGLAQTYTHLLLARIGVGVGEAGCSPPCHSMISDIFPVQERATAFATYNIGVNLGVLVGFLLGGWLQQYFGWRVALLAVGLPGILLAALFRFTIAEPRRDKFTPQSVAESSKPGPTIIDVLTILWSKRTFRYLAIAAAMCGVSGYGLLNWMPSFLIRSHDLNTGIIGTWLALVVGVGGGIATLAAGYFSDRLGLKDKRWYAWVPAILFGVSAPATLAMLLTEDSNLALMFFIVPGVMVQTYLAPVLAITHSLVESRMRALSSAVVLLVVNLIGLALGPLIIGLLSDWLSLSMGSESLRFAMMIVITGAFLICVFSFILASQFIKKEM